MTTPSSTSATASPCPARTCQGRMTNVDRRQARREGARDRHRLGLSVGLPRQSDRAMPTRSRSSSRWPSARRGIYDKLIDKRLHRVPAHQDQERRRLLRLGRGGAVRQDHRHLRHRPCAAAAAAAAQGRRHDGDPGRPAGRPARAQGRQDPGRRRLDHRRRARTSTAARSCRSCPSPSSKATRSSARTTAESRLGAAVSTRAPVPGLVSVRRLQPMTAPLGCGTLPAGDRALTRYRRPRATGRRSPSTCPSGWSPAAIIALQIGIMRVFSVGSWAHFGSLVVSLAMFGFGLTCGGDVRRQGLVRAPLAAAPPRSRCCCSGR